MKIRYFGIALLLASFPLSYGLPVTAGYENGPVENMQAILLLVGGIIAAVFARRSAPPVQWFWYAAVPIWIAMCLRELSWGAVFLPPTAGTADQGPLFSSAQLWYKPYVAPILLAALVFSCGCFLKGGGVGIFRKLITDRTFPLPDILHFVLSMLVSAAAEGHLGLGMGDWSKAVVLEEVAELAAYIFILSAQVQVWQGMAAQRQLRG